MSSDQATWLNDGHFRLDPIEDGWFLVFCEVPYDDSLTVTLSDNGEPFASREAAADAGRRYVRREGVIRTPTAVELHQQRVADADRQMRQGIEKAAVAIREFGAAVTRAATAIRVVPESMARVMAAGTLPGSHRTARLRKKRRKAVERILAD